MVLYILQASELQGRQDGEAEGVDKVHYRTVVSRRNLSKVMYMGVVGKPVPEKGYDGKVFLKRFSETVNLKRKSYRHDFTDNRFMNQEKKKMGRGRRWYRRAKTKSPISLIPLLWNLNLMWIFYLVK